MNTTSSGEPGLLWFALFLFGAPAAAFFLVLNCQVPLDPLVGMDSLCAQCDRKATRTLPKAADALRTRGVYVYDRNRYPKAAPIWCDQHGPDPAAENAGRASAAALGIFAVVIVGYRCITLWLQGLGSVELENAGGRTGEKQVVAGSQTSGPPSLPAIPALVSPVRPADPTPPHMWTPA